MSARSLTLEQASQFVLHAAETLREVPHPRSPHSIRCIDHRIDGEQVPPIAIPGEKFGILLASLAAKKVLETETNAVIPLEFDHIKTLVEKKFNVLTFHTDSEHHKKSAHNPQILPCSGCGHCQSAFASPEEYLLSEMDILFLEEYVRILAEGGIHPTVYPSTEMARALMVIDELDITMAPRVVTGARVYVYSRAIHRQILAEIARDFYEQISVPSLSVGTVTNAFFVAAEKQFQATGKRLLKNLPKFRVFRDTRRSISVEPLADTVSAKKRTISIGL